MTKTFRVISISTKPNSFGLHGHILVARDGTAFEVGRYRGRDGDACSTAWNKGDDVEIPYITDEGSPCRPCWASVSCEIPRELTTATPDFLLKLYPGTPDKPKRKRAPRRDITIENHGSIVLFRPLTGKAKRWMGEHCSDAQYFGISLVVEPRYAEDLRDNAINDGMNL